MSGKAQETLAINELTLCLPAFPEVFQTFTKIGKMVTGLSLIFQVGGEMIKVAGVQNFSSFKLLGAGEGQGQRFREQQTLFSI